MKTAATREAVKAALEAAGLTEDRDLTGIDCRGYTFRADISYALEDFQERTGFPANIFRAWSMHFVLGHRFGDVALEPEASPA